MEDLEFEIVRVLQWERIESGVIRDERNPSRPMRVRPKTVEARCRRCDVRWIEKRNESRPDNPGWQQTSPGHIGLTCPSCNGAAANHLLDLEQGFAR